MVKEIIDHRMKDQGRMKFLTVWEGYHESDATREPVGNFIHQYSSDVVKHCQTHDITPDVLGDLSPEPQHHVLPCTTVWLPFRLSRHTVLLNMAVWRLCLGALIRIAAGYGSLACLLGRVGKQRGGVWLFGMLV